MLIDHSKRHSAPNLKPKFIPEKFKKDMHHMLEMVRFIEKNCIEYEFLD